MLIMYHHGMQGRSLSAPAILSVELKSDFGEFRPSAARAIDDRPYKRNDSKGAINPNLQSRTLFSFFGAGVRIGLDPHLRFSAVRKNNGIPRLGIPLFVEE